MGWYGDGEFAAMNVGGGVPDAPQVSSLSRGIGRAASPLAAVEVCGGGKCLGGINPSPTNLPQKGYGGRLRAGHARPLQTTGMFTATIVGGGVLDAPQIGSPSRGIGRAASPLAAAAVCGSGKFPGGMNPSPTN